MKNKVLHFIHDIRCHSTFCGVPLNSKIKTTFGDNFTCKNCERSYKIYKRTKWANSN